MFFQSYTMKTRSSTYISTFKGRMQASLTNSEKDKSMFQIDHRSAREKITHLERQKESLLANLTAIENKMKVATKTVQLKDAEISSYRLFV